MLKSRGMIEFLEFPDPFEQYRFVWVRMVEFDAALDFIEYILKRIHIGQDEPAAGFDDTKGSPEGRIDIFHEGYGAGAYSQIEMRIGQDCQIGDIGVYEIYGLPVLQGQVDRLIDLAPGEIDRGDMSAHFCQGDRVLAAAAAEVYDFFSGYIAQQAEFIVAGAERPVMHSLGRDLVAFTVVSGDLIP